MPGFAPRNVLPPKPPAGVGIDSVTIVPAGKPDIPPLLMLTGMCWDETPPLSQPQPDCWTGIETEVPVLPQPQPPALWPMPPSRIGPPATPHESQSDLPNPKCFL